VDHDAVPTAYLARNKNRLNKTSLTLKLLVRRGIPVSIRREVLLSLPVYV
jgi:hypothetical protein